MKRKVALLIGYDGRGYSGLQWNKELNTIEKTVLEKLKDLELVSEQNAEEAKKVGLKSSSRTDKGVHASFNVMCLKINTEPTEEVANNIRKTLEPLRMRLYGIKKVPKRFIGHKAARSRVYSYTIPTAILLPNDLSKEVEALRESDAQLLPDPAKANRKFPEREYTVGKTLPLFKNITVDTSKFIELMKRYEGTHSFHNFTVKANENGAKRFIKSINVSDPFIEDGIEYVEVVIHGQSFLLHQIRKMISFAVLNARYAPAKSDENFKQVFEGDVHVPKAPSEYLYLREVTFEDYNKRVEEKLLVNEADRRAFEEEILEPAIRNENNLISWLKFFDAVRFHSDKMKYLIV